MTAGDDIMDIRAAEMAALRRNLREVKKQLAAARDNDAIVGALHNLAVLLISNSGGGKIKGGGGDGLQWRGRAEKMLARALPTIAKCRIIAADELDGAQKRQAAKLPAGGGAGLMDGGFAVAGLPSVYAVPLKKKGGAGVCGLLLLYARNKNAFPAGTASDFALRLGQLLAAAMAK